MRAPRLRLRGRELLLLLRQLGLERGEAGVGRARAGGGGRGGGGGSELGGELLLQLELVLHGLQLLRVLLPLLLEVAPQLLLLPRKRRLPLRRLRRLFARRSLRRLARAPLCLARLALLLARLRRCQVAQRLLLRLQPARHLRRTHAARHGGADSARHLLCARRRRANPDRGLGVTLLQLAQPAPTHVPARRRQRRGIARLQVRDRGLAGADGRRDLRRHGRGGTLDLLADARLHLCGEPRLRRAHRLVHGADLLPQRVRLRGHLRPLRLLRLLLRPLQLRHDRGGALELRLELGPHAMHVGSHVGSQRRRRAAQLRAAQLRAQVGVQALPQLCRRLALDSVHRGPHGRLHRLRHEHGVHRRRGHGRRSRARRNRERRPAPVINHRERGRGRGGRRRRR